MPEPKEAASIKVVSDDPKPKEDKEPKKQAGPEAEDSKAEELSEEDKELVEKLQLAVSRLSDTDGGVQKLALETLRSEIRTSTSSMTSVPKPLKFLRPHYGQLKELYKTNIAASNRKALADILAVLAMTMAPEGSRESLRFKLEGNRTELGDWGHEFVRSLAGEISEEYQVIVTAEEGSVHTITVADLTTLVDAVVPFHMQHNAEPEAIDILLEVQQLEKLLSSPDIDDNNYQRICIYLLGCADYMSDPDDLETLLKTAYELYKRVKQFPQALRVALRMDDTERIGALFTECDDESLKKQISNVGIPETFQTLARDLDVLEAKVPEDIYKSHLSETASTARNRDHSGQPVDSARHNLASTFVNAFVNAAYSSDKLITPEGNAWLYKNKDHGMMSAAASLGLILLWNVDEGLTQIDKFLYSTEEFIKAGAILAVGIVSSGVRNACDPALALLSEHLETDPDSSKKTGTNSTGGGNVMRLAAIVGLGLAYAGTAREDVLEILSPIVANTTDASFYEVALAALSLGMIFVGTCNDDVGSVLAQRLMEASDTELDQSASRFLALGLGLLFVGHQDKADGMIEAVKTVEHKLATYAAITLDTCAYAGTGNVLKVQELLRVCAEHIEDPVASQHQQVAVLGIALTVVGENIGTEMSIRAFDHLLQYGELPVRRAVPLALALLRISNPDYTTVDTLSRLSHDNDAEVAQSAIMGLGLCSAGTNNSRVAGLLRQLAEFYYREPATLFVVRLAQGLLHMGKGLITINPFHSDRLLLSKIGLGGILTVLHASLDMKSFFLDKFHYLLYYLVCAMAPRMLITVDEELNPLPVTVRVGQARLTHFEQVETVGQAGRPKTITGFQTHTTPVLLNQMDRAELATEEYLPCSPILEGIVILKKNPEYVPDKS